MQRSSLILIFLFLAPGVFGQKKRSLAPDFAVLQYAGSIGLINGGLGYQVFEGAFRASVHYGSVPRNQGGTIHVFAAKVIYSPLEIIASPRLLINPIDLGTMVSWHQANELRSHWPESQYPRGYYWWHPSLRLHLLTESSLTYELPPEKKFKAITCYAELNINDLYLVSYVQNVRSLRITDVVKTGVGIRVSF